MTPSVSPSAVQASSRIGAIGSIKLPHGNCPACQCQDLLYAFATSGGAFFECKACNLLVCDPTQSHLERKARDFWAETERSSCLALTEEEKQGYLGLIKQNSLGTRLLEVGCGRGIFLQAARRQGFEVAGFEGNAEWAEAAADRLGRDAVTCATDVSGAYPPGSFDVVVVFELIGHFPDPLDMLRTMRCFLREGGLLVFCVPLIDSRPARLLGEEWVEFHKRHSVLFDANTIQNALFLAGFHQSLVLRHPRLLSIDRLRNYLRQFRLPRGLRWLARLAGLIPPPLRRMAIRVEGSHGVVFTRARPVRDEPTLSVVVPAYNERATFSTLMDALLAKEVPGVRKEIVIVESNSTDGTREEVLRYREVPEVRIVLQDRPLGKGNAVRAGLETATGQFVLIQDADLEYDLNDYETLLEPLISCRQAFVIGSRHSTNNWKRRKFSDSAFRSFFYNTGHVVFQTLFNAIYRQRLRDPFSMFKVFRRECLFGLSFECNRFDFDFELVIKLLRKGYRVIELPVNYASRSHKDGKKVSAWRDPITWFAALAKYRVQRLNVWSNAERALQHSHAGEQRELI